MTETLFDVVAFSYVMVDIENHWWQTCIILQHWQKYWPVLEEASQTEGHQLEDCLHDEDEGENVVTDLQSFVQLLEKKNYYFHV